MNRKIYHDREHLQELVRQIEMMVHKDITVYTATLLQEIKYMLQRELKGFDEIEAGIQE